MVKNITVKESPNFLASFIASLVLHLAIGGYIIYDLKEFRMRLQHYDDLKTDKKGRVVVKFKLPDTLTTYRATAIAVKSNLFGIKENEIIVQNPINVKTALPRKLRVRDTSFAGVVATNLTNKTEEISISIESDILTIEGNKTK
ncbi:MAG: alpha-2-macroglobulin family protein, partial [Sulfurovaceae bacterium]